MAVKRNPFMLPGSDRLEYTSAVDRIHAVTSFDFKDCVDAIAMGPYAVQKSVRKVIGMRIKELNNSKVRDCQDGGG